MDPEIRQLRALVAVVDEGTFTDAAIALGTSQASVSRSVAALERTLGVKVLQRSTRQISLTVTGASVLPHARAVLAELAAMRRLLEEGDGEVRIGFAWSALGRHTTTVQQRWASAFPGSQLVFVQSSHRSVGLTEGLVDVAVSRVPIDDSRIATALVGEERRMAVLPTGDVLARRRRLRLADLAGRVVGANPVNSTTTEDLWPAGAGPAGWREVQGVDDWLTLIAAEQAVGVTSEATAVQYRRPGVVYRPLVDAPPLPVLLAWWRDDPPSWLGRLREVITDVYRSGAGEPIP